MTSANKTGTKRIFLFALLFLMFALPAGAPGAEAPFPKGKIVRVGTDPTAPPFSFYDENGKLVGFSVEIAEELCKRMGKRAEFVIVPFSSLIPSLLEKKIDLIASSMSDTPARRSAVDFTRTINKTWSATIIRRNRTSEIKTFADLNGKIAAAKEGSIHFDIIRKNAEPKKILATPGVLESLEAVAAEKADFAQADYAGTRFLLDKNKELNRKLKVAFLTESHPGKGGLAFAIRKGQPETLKTFDTLILDMFQEGVIRTFEVRYKIDL